MGKFGQSLFLISCCGCSDMRSKAKLSGGYLTLPTLQKVFTLIRLVSSILPSFGRLKGCHSSVNSVQELNQTLKQDHYFDIQIVILLTRMLLAMLWVQNRELSHSFVLQNSLFFFTWSTYFELVIIQELSLFHSITSLMYKDAILSPSKREQ